MARDYIEVLNKARFSGGDHAAAKSGKSAPVLFASKKRSKHLTAAVKSASLRSGVRVRQRRGNTGKPPSKGASHMAKRRKARRSGRKLTKAERREISIRNLRKARKSPKRRRRHARAAAPAAAQAPRRRRARRVHRRRHHARAAAPAAMEAPRRRRAKRTKRRFTRKARAAAMRNLGKARAKRRYYKRIHRKHPVKAYNYHRKPKRIRVRAHRSYEAPRRRRRTHRRRHAAGSRKHGRRHHRAREKYIMENPLSGGELFIGVLTGGIGFVTMSMVDRFLATHALLAGATGAANANTFNDTPPTTGDYPNLYNATAVLAPMNWKRWAAGTLGPLVPIFAATMVKAPAGRSALQMFGVGALLHTAGKGLTTLVAKLSQSSSFGNRMYDAEIRAAALAAGTTTTAPSSGLGRAMAARQMGTGSVADTNANRRYGCGACNGNASVSCKVCRSGSYNPVSQQPPPPSALPIPPPSVTQPSSGIPSGVQVGLPSGVPSGTFPLPSALKPVGIPVSPPSNYPTLTGVPRRISRNDWAAQ